MVKKVLLASTLLLFLATISIGQDKPEPILVDEYTELKPCDDFIARLDAYFNEFQMQPGWTGFVVLRNTPAKTIWGARVQSMIEAWAKYRGFGRRIEFVRASGPEHSREFWRIPPGSSKPQVENALVGFTMPTTVTKPFLLEYETRYPMQICPEIDNLEIFANFLRDNPAARGNIVARDQSRSRARRKATQLKRELISHGISARRVRTFTAFLQKPSNDDEAIVEYWFLP